MNLSIGNHRKDLEVANGCGCSDQKEALDFMIFGGYGSYSVYPNPAEEQLAVTVSSSETEASTATIDLYNSKGKKVYSAQAQKGNDKIKVDVRGFAKGNYVLHIIQNGKIIIRHIIIGK